jgi:RNA polymerase sigma-70 factor (ECF subfamily)
MIASGGPQSVTFWLHRWRDGDNGALDELTRLVYADLRRLAAHHLRSEIAGHTLQATALVHELYLRISSVQEMDWKGRGHFVGVAAQMMRRILTDHARRRLAQKRLRGAAADLPDAPDQIDVVAVDRALDRLALDFPRHAQIVELRFFGGLDSPEVARSLGLSLRTVERDWQFAKGWLKREIAGL